MAEDTTSGGVIRLLRDAQHGGRPAWPNYDTITTGAQYRILHRLCREWILPGGSVLDWGAGTGHASIYLSRAGFRATGYSFDSFSYRDLLGDAPYRFVRARPNEPIALPFDDGEFDAVLSVGVLEHVRETGGDEGASLREIRRVLRPGGVLICVYLPNKRSWIEAFARWRGAGGHRYRFTGTEIRKLFRESGLHVERMGRYGALPRNQVARVIPRRLCDSQAFSKLYDATDVILAAMIPWFVQNHYVVARCPAPDATSHDRRPA
jgi:SAM-dependent methyltransferase